MFLSAFFRRINLVAKKDLWRILIRLSKTSLNRRKQRNKDHEDLIWSNRFLLGDFFLRLIICSILFETQFTLCSLIEWSSLEKMIMGNDSTRIIEVWYIPLDIFRLLCIVITNDLVIDLFIINWIESKMSNSSNDARWEYMSRTIHLCMYITCFTFIYIS